MIFLLQVLLAFATFLESYPTGSALPAFGVLEIVHLVLPR
jgi:hypothetical protein